MGTGQDWTILNLDKRQIYRLDWYEELSLFPPNSNYGVLFWLLVTHLKNPAQRAKDATWSWAGDRIIYLGHDNHTMGHFPKDLLTDAEREELRGFDQDLCELAYELYHDASCDIQSPKPSGPSWVLRNLSKHEYVRSDAVEMLTGGGADYDRTTPQLVDVLACRFCWSSIPGTRTAYQPPWPGYRPLHHGIWAGDRFDIVASSDFDGGLVGWKDVSTTARRELFEIWEQGKYGKETVDSWKPSAKHIHIAIESSFPHCPQDIARDIMEYAAAGDIMDALSISRVSKLAHAWMTPVIYRSVILDKPHRVVLFCNTLQSNPEIGTNVHRLFLRSSAPPCDRNSVTQPACTISTAILDALHCCKNITLLVTNIDVSFLTQQGDGDIVKAPSPLPALHHVIAIPTNRIFSETAHLLPERVTHLCINAVELVKLEFRLPESFGHVTHLALFCQSDRMRSFGDRYFPHILDEILRCHSIKVLLLIEKTDYALPNAPLEGRLWAKLAQIQDERLFARCGLDIDDWEGIMRDGSTFFDDVEIKYKSWRDLVLIGAQP